MRPTIDAFGDVAASCLPDAAVPQYTVTMRAAQVLFLLRNPHCDCYSVADFRGFEMSNDALLASHRVPRSSLAVLVLCASTLVVASGAQQATPRADVRGRGAAVAALDRYARGDLTLATSPRVLVPELADLQRAVPAWIRAGGAGNDSRRRLTAATYVLERLSQIYDIAIWRPSQAAPIMLEWACSLLRERPPLPEERVWHAASVALLERGGARLTLLEHLGHAERRFPADARWALARAVAEEIAMWPDPRDERPFSIANAVSVRFTQAVTRAAVLEPVRAEAQVRWGYFELRRDRIDTALSHFKQAGSPTDAFVSYWLHLFTGRALERANRSAEAIDAYQLAVADAPFAQAATVALSAALVEGHRSAESTSLITRLLALPSPAIDPWGIYPAPEWRFYKSWIEELRMALSRQP